MFFKSRGLLLQSRGLDLQFLNTPASLYRLVTPFITAICHISHASLGVARPRPSDPSISVSNDSNTFFFFFFCVACLAQFAYCWGVKYYRLMQLEIGSDQMKQVLGVSLIHDHEVRVESQGLVMNGRRRWATA